MSHDRYTKTARNLLSKSWLGAQKLTILSEMIQVYKFKFDLQPGSLTDQVAGEHQPSYKHP